ncbi:MAG TPA: class 1 fructose-bisphosphatase [Pirellulales bacterium]|nr:class 1 fructose-bisphosphatase [Pirellulales bacterium]
MIVTVEQHILLEQRKRFPQATGAFSWLLSGITLATKMTQAKVRRGGLLDVLGEAGTTNLHGEAQHKLDVYANQALLHCLRMREDVAILASEENDDPVMFEGRAESGKYIVVVDPLDGSSNIDVNVGVGTIFSILLQSPIVSRDHPHAAVLQPGVRQIAAGYVVYGSSTILVYTSGQGVHGFTLDPEIGAYVLSHENIRMPEAGKIYSVNEANADSFPEEYQQYLGKLRSGALGRRYTSRYIGSLVADFHRTLIKGGVFLYPPTRDYPQGKLRLLYEANPIAFIAEQAGGMATDGTGRIMEIQPHDIHQRVPLVVGGKTEVQELSHCTRGRERLTAARMNGTRESVK